LWTNVRLKHVAKVVEQRDMPSRFVRPLLILATAVGFAASTGTAAANPSDPALEYRSANAPGGETTPVDEQRPAGAGQGRKIG
jgi:hypothetical protein